MSKIETLIEKYVALRDKKQELEQAHKARVAQYRQVMDKIEAVIQEAFNESGAESMKTNAGTAYRSVRTSARVDDPEIFRKFVESNRAWAMMDARANKSAVEAYMDEHEAPPPGVSVTRMHTINIRRS